MYKIICEYISYTSTTLIVNTNILNLIKLFNNTIKTYLVTNPSILLYKLTLKYVPQYVNYSTI